MSNICFKFFFLLFSLSIFCQTNDPCGFEDGLQVGTCKEFYEDGQLKVMSNWKAGKLDGDYIFYFQNGKIQSKGSYKKGEQIGKWFFYSENGKPISEESYMYDKGIKKKNGLFRFFNKEGVLIDEVNYKDDLFDGQGKLFYDNGNLKQIANYKKGESVGMVTIYKENKPNVLDGTGKLKNNNVIGEWTYYHEDGKTIETKGSYDDNGKQIGLWQSFYKNGKVKAQSTYVNGKREGERTLFNEDGTVSKTEQYSKGELVSDQKSKKGKK